MRERGQILLACLIGAVLCVGAALLISPTNWWLGLAAGIAAGFVSGYLSYEFKEVLAAVRTAWNKAVTYRPCLIPSVRKILLALTCLGFTITIPLLIVVVTSWGIQLAFTGYYMFGSLLASVAIAIAVIQVDWMEKAWRKDIEAKELGMVAFLVSPLAAFTYWPVWLIWKAAGGIKRYGPRAPAYSRIGLSFTIRFVKTVFVLIHCNSRLICGIDGTAGGLIALFLLGMPATSISAAALTFIFGGLLGMAIGFGNKEYVVPRLQARGLMPVDENSA